ncbi:hypothetical protein [Haloferula sp. A504]|uniref:hypothetical protein n=1 Tax=Haloferula sp. A504 TaxID=3373601 RepID=UPI0031C7F839|nr:hypothetical protein [Verrucomicrobiaceae bacterium E54]
MKKEAEDRGFCVLAANTEELVKLSDYSRTLLCELSKEDQIAFVNLRNQWVHGYLSAPYTENVGVKYVEGGLFVRERISGDAYNKIISDRIGAQSVDAYLGPHVGRILGASEEYWRMMAALEANERNVYQALLENRPIRFTVRAFEQKESG